MTESTTYNVTPTTIESDCDTTEGGISSTTFYPIVHKTSMVTATTLTKSLSSSVPMETMTYQRNDNITLIVCLVIILVVAIIAVTVSLLVFFIRYYVCKRLRSQQVTCGNIERQPKCANMYQETDCTVTQIQSCDSALIIYSPNTVESERQLICTLISELQKCQIGTMSHDLTCIQGGPSAWLESEVKKATVVLCVCNKEFKDDWEEEEEESQQVSLPLVRSLKHLIHGTIQSSQSLSKYAVVLLDPSHKHYIPTMYLQSASRQFILTGTEAEAHKLVIEAIAEYVKQ